MRAARAPTWLSSVSRPPDPAHEAVSRMRVRAGGEVMHRQGEVRRVSTSLGVIDHRSVARLEGRRRTSCLVQGEPPCSG